MQVLVKFFAAMAMQLGYNASMKCCGVRFGEEMVVEDDLVGMSILITQRCSTRIVELMIAFQEDTPDDINFKRSAFFYAKFFTEHYKTGLRTANQDKWDEAVVAVIADMRLNPVD